MVFFSKALRLQRGHQSEGWPKHSLAASLQPPHTPRHPLARSFARPPPTYHTDTHRGAPATRGGQPGAATLPLPSLVATPSSSPAPPPPPLIPSAPGLPLHRPCHRVAHPAAGARDAPPACLLRERAHLSGQAGAAAQQDEGRAQRPGVHLLLPHRWRNVVWCMGLLPPEAHATGSCVNSSK